MEKNVLAVDDDDDFLFALEAMSEEADFNLIAVNNFKEALKILNQKDISLVIVDYYMPDMNGLELVKEIRDKYPDKPILVLTVDESLQVAEKFLNAGADDFANKPIKVADLISRINLHLKMTKNTKSDKNSRLNIENINIPKGVSYHTLNIIINHLKSCDNFKDIEEISEETGLAYQTTHRYLQLLEKNNYLEVSYEYGEVGRPIHKYKYNQP